jgi:hypothetical protein
MRFWAWGTRWEIGRKFACSGKVLPDDLVREDRGEHRGRDHQQDARDQQQRDN